MCCVIAALGLVGPRLAFLIWWLVDSVLVMAAMGGRWFVALLGLLFLPWTALAWVAVWAPVQHVTGFGWAVVALCFVLDISSYTAGRRGQLSR